MSAFDWSMTCWYKTHAPGLQSRNITGGLDVAMHVKSVISKRFASNTEKAGRNSADQNNGKRPYKYKIIKPKTMQQIILRNLIFLRPCLPNSVESRNMKH